MKRAEECRKCKKWFKDPHEAHQVVTDKYDPSLCPKCNQEIDKDWRGWREKGEDSPV